MGCWYGNKYVISSEFKWLAHMVSTSMLLINKVSFTLEASGNDHTLAGIRTLFRFYNSAGNAVRYFCVANVPKDLGKKDPTCLDGLKLLETVDGMLAAQMVAREHQGTFLLSLIILQLCNPEPQMFAFKGQIKPYSRLAHHRFSHKKNEQICFVFLLFYSSRQKNTNSFIRFLGESTARKSAYGFI